MSKPLHFFIAGIIQGSLPTDMHSQDYRNEIGDLLHDAFPGSTVFDPIREYPNSIEYEDARASAAFFDLMDRAGNVDVLIAFVPEASMGTAIELWNAHHAGSLVVAISGLEKNWVVRFLSDIVAGDMKEFRKIVKNGTLAAAIEEKLGKND